MRECGISFVRIGEFAWSRLEPAPGKFDWGWLDDAIDVLGRAGLKVVMCTPTPTPPKWLVDQYPDILPVDAGGQVKKFGSRRHYDHSSATFRKETARIVSAVAKRYGTHPYLAGWQTDNEYGCHGTIHSFSESARLNFRQWLKAKYKKIDALNTAWGNVFWSMEYRGFDEVDLPNQTVTEANPSHWLDYYRFASDEVVAYNRIHTDLIRKHSPGRFITHNFMLFFTDFDHYKVAEDLDLASWDSYPLGALDWPMRWADNQTKTRYARTGHPDFTAWHHDLYRSVGRGRWWVMEQQPGPVNWAMHNPSPAAGMVRLWTWEVFAHGGEVCSYFRWRQAPFAQEQYHAGLNLPNFEPDVGFYEAQQVAKEVKQLGLEEAWGSPQAPVALVYDYQADWLTRTQPQGQEFNHLELTFNFYSALRGLGLSVDLLRPGASLQGYKLVVVPSLPMLRNSDIETLKTFKGRVVFGPRTGSKTESLTIPHNLPPGPLQDLFPIQVTRVESLRPSLTEDIQLGRKKYPVSIWKEWAQSKLKPIAHFADGRGAIYQHKNLHYLAFWPSPEILAAYLGEVANQAGLSLTPLPEGLRIRNNGKLNYAFNYSDQTRSVPAPKGVRFILGGRNLKPYDVAIWEEPQKGVAGRKPALSRAEGSQVSGRKARG
jgi:beta-galactosidase